MKFNFHNSYAKLPEQFFCHQQPSPVSSPSLLAFNLSLASELQLETSFPSEEVSKLKHQEELAQLFSGNVIAEGAEPIAMAYAGHQFGNAVPQLGDGRALLLGEVVDKQGRRRDIQLKGSGPTPFSRGGDGRSPLGPVIREYLVSESMHALGVPSTRALAAVSTGDSVYRNDKEPGAILTRVANSHIRVGTFQYFAFKGDSESLGLLCDYVIDRLYPGIVTAAASSPDIEDRTTQYLSLFREIVRAQASLVANWMSLGFIHGVMNTDNCSISGETIDFGPCAFLDQYQPDKVFSAIDRGGRYAYQNQPNIAHWNLARLAECLLPLLHEDGDHAVSLIKPVLDEYPALFKLAWSEKMAGKLGLSAADDQDITLIQDLLGLLASHKIDYTLLFRRLSYLTGDEPDPMASVAWYQQSSTAGFLSNNQDFLNWRQRWLQRLAELGRAPNATQRIMLQHNPAYIPRNHQVAKAIQSAEQGDYSYFESLIPVFTQPYLEQFESHHLQKPPVESEMVNRTFCGT